MSHHTVVKSHAVVASWSGWGDPAQATTLSPETAELAQTALGINHPGRPAPSIAGVVLPPPALTTAVLAALAALLGDEHLLTGTEDRLRHTRGKSTPDLLRLRNGDLSGAPDAVAVPGSHEDCVAVLELCARENIAVVPFGGGTSVVGGLEPERTGFAGVLALDLRRLDRLVELDEISRIATLEPGLRGPEAEGLLNARGYTLGHFPQSFEFATIGGFAAARSSGQASAGYGRFDERVVALRLATPRGTIRTGDAPRTAAGPDLRQLFLGSEGAFGVITSVTVEVTPLPAVRVYEGWRMPSFEDGTGVLRTLAQDGPLPTVLRLSDEAATAINLAMPDAIGAGAESGGALVITGFEGSAEEVAARREGVAAVLRAGGATPDPDAGASWEHGRYSAPYLRDALLDLGAMVETLETAAFWSGLPGLYAGVREALTQTLASAGTPPLVLCHISHVYRSGASLYFTVACAQAEDPVAQWQAAKAAASDAILAAGGAITHHHGVGRDHRPWYERELGELGIAALRAVKRELDPAGILNPGVLLP
jgi:alkyldihydroxyacetonephosphate synthase